MDTTTPLFVCKFFRPFRCLQFSCQRYRESLTSGVLTV
jgi:hypothetical protein